jgi:hypothetical protein
MDQEWIRLGGLNAAIATLALVIVGCSEPARAEPRILADFDDTPGVWSVSEGPEFPGGAGEFTTAHGVTGRGGRLVYAFTCVEEDQCGAYVAAELQLGEIVNIGDGDALALSIAPEEADPDLAIRITDGTGQVLQFGLAEFSIEHQAPRGWRQAVLRFDREANEHWDGVDNGRITNGIAAIAFLARGSAPKHGRLLLDDIRIVDVRDQAYTLAHNRRARTRSVEPPLIGVNIRDRSNLAAIDSAQALGIGLVRTDLFWSRVEQNGFYDFTAFDPLVDALEARQMQALLILTYGHPDHGGGGAVTGDPDRAAYAAYAAASAAHYRGRPVAFEIWNEPDTGDNRRYEPEDYARLARETSVAIRAANPRAQVISGGLSWTSRSYFNAMLPGLHGAHFTAIGIHPYRGGGPESVANDFAWLRPLVDDSFSGATPPLWVTEWGFSSSRHDGDGHAPEGRRAQGALMARQLLTLWALHVPVAVWYELQDRDPFPREGSANYGLLDLQGQPKPAYDAMRTFNSVARGRRLTAVLQDLPPLAHGVRIDGSRDTIYAIWTEAPGGRVSVTAPNILSALDAFGAPIAYDGHHRVVVTEADGPVYLRVSR